MGAMLLWYGYQGIRYGCAGWCCVCVCFFVTSFGWRVRGSSCKFLFGLPSSRFPLARISHQSTCTLLAQLISVDHRGPPWTAGGRRG